MGMTEGNPQCWLDGQRSFATCCHETGAGWQQQLRVSLVPAFRLMFTGGMGLASLGFAMFVWRQVMIRWREVNGSARYWQVGFFIMWICHFSGKALGRIVAVFGSVLAFKELYAVMSAKARQIATKIGDR